MKNNKEMLDFAIENMIKYPNQIELFRHCLYDLATQGKIEIKNENSLKLYHLLEDDVSENIFKKDWKLFQIEQLYDIKNCKEEDLKKGDILFPNTFKDKFEKSSVYFFEEDKKYIYSNFKLIRPKINKVLPEFLFYILKSSNFQNQLNKNILKKRYSTCNFHSLLYITLFNEIQVLIPSIEKQKEIIESVKKLDNKLKQLKVLSEEMEANSEKLLKSLIKKMTFVSSENK